jgi:hypothetical protein
MRPLEVVDAPIGIERTLLSALVRGPLHLTLERPMEAFEATVLLRGGGCNALEDNAEPEQPDAKRRERSRRRRGEERLLRTASPVGSRKASQRKRRRLSRRAR